MQGRGIRALPCAESERLVGVLVARTRAPLARFSERNFSPAHHYAAISQRLDATAFIDELRADWDQRSAACPAQLRQEHHGAACGSPGTHKGEVC